MRRQRYQEIQPWMLFAFPAAIVVPIVAGFLLGGPVLGFLVAGLVAVAIVAVAIGMEPRERSRTATRSENGAAAAPDAADRSAAARRFLVPLVIAAIGIVLIAARGATVSVIGWGVFAVAITVAISLVFLEIGYSEDRARAHDKRAGGSSARRRRERSSARR